MHRGCVKGVLDTDAFLTVMACVQGPSQRCTKARKDVRRRANSAKTHSFQLQMIEESRKKIVSILKNLPEEQEGGASLAGLSLGA